MTTRVRAVGVFGIVLASGGLAATPAAAPNGTPITIAVAGRASANPSMGASGSFVGLAWAARTKDGVTDVYAATSRDGGRSFGAPVRVNQVPGDASASGEQPPRIVVSASRSAQPPVTVVWTAKSASGTRLVSARSVDGGKSFGPAQPVPGTDATGNRGWESAAVTPNGEVVAAWLDHRDVPARPAGTAAAPAHQHGASTPTPRPAAESVARAQLSQIFFARLDEPASARAIAPGVCYCCKTSIAAGADGTVVAAWRHVYPGNVRDIALSASSDGGRTFAPPVRVSEDAWVLDGCPENGPDVAIDWTGAVHVVWPTLVRDPGAAENLGLFHAVSKDARAFTPRQRVPTVGTPKHVQMDVGPDGAITVVWDELASGARRIVMARGTRDPSGVRFARSPVSEESGSYPAVAALADAAVVAWMGGAAGDTVLRVVRHAAAR